MQKTTLYLPTDLHRQLEELARRSGSSQAELIREAIRTFLQDQQQPALRSLGITKSQEITGRTARAWLREHWRVR